MIQLSSSPHVAAKTVVAYTSKLALNAIFVEYIYSRMLLTSLLEMMIDSTSGIRRSDINTLFNNVASNPLGNPIATNFLVNRWNEIEAS